MLSNDSQEDSTNVLNTVNDQSTLLQRIHDLDIVSLNIYNSDGLYFCIRSDMEEKIHKHITQTDVYVLLKELNDDTNSTYIRQHLDNIVEHITLLLNDLLTRQCITHSQFYQMLVERSMVRMDYLYFLPDTSKVSYYFLSSCLLEQYVYISRKEYLFDRL